MNKLHFLNSLFFIFHIFNIFEIHATKINVAYDTFTPSNGKISSRPPIVFLHGILDSKKTWKYIAQPISDNTGRTVYTLDARNHGNSTWTEEFSMENMVEDLEDFINDQNISVAIIVGHSMGGRAAQAWALRQPHRVEKLIVEDMSTLDFFSVPHPGIGYLIRLVKKAVATVPPSSSEEELFNSTKEFFKKKVPKEFLPERALDVAPINFNGGKLNWEVNFEVLEERLYAGALGINLTGTYEVDTLFIYGSTSVLRVDTDVLIKKFFPKAEILGFIGANHLVHQEYPEDYLREITRFITGLITPSLKC